MQPQTHQDSLDSVESRLEPFAATCEFGENVCNFPGAKLIDECCSEMLYRRLLCEKFLTFTGLQEIKGKEAESVSHKDGKKC